ncbi:MAG: hypothetical protein HQ568_02365 [Calditrichaeota bacterium]|nr:hypothetical protein [Calditrichota bacterium]
MCCGVRALGYLEPDRKRPISGVRRPRLTRKSSFFRQARTPDGTLNHILRHPVVRE